MMHVQKTFAAARQRGHRRNLRVTIAGLVQLRDELREQLGLANESVESVLSEVSASAQELDQQRSDLVEKESKITELAEKVHETAEKHQGQTAEWALKSAELEQALSVAVTERDDHYSRLQSALGELDSLADMLEVLQATQDELHRTRSELEAVQGQRDAEGSGVRGSELAEAKAENELLRQQLQENHDRFGKVSETVQRQEKELSILRKRWSDELTQMRDGGQPAAAPEVAAEPTWQTETVEHEVVDADPVVGSLLAEFDSFESATPQ